MRLGIHRLSDLVKIPTMGTNEAACFDISANWDHVEYIKYYTLNNTVKELVVKGKSEITIIPGQRMMIPTGIIFDIPINWSVRVHNRSGVALKQGLVLVNHEGIIDSDFTHECHLLMANISGQPVAVKNYDRLCQGEMVPVNYYVIEEEREKPETRGNRIGGYGSTGVSS